MCGLNGIFAYGAAAPQPSEAELLATRDHMRARGPDGAGAWWSADRRVALGHRRLSIIDLSERANQPMRSTDGRLTIVFNGEIYNYPALRVELEARGCVFRTTSDTEALLHLYALEGAAMTRRLRGMFAFGIWDAEKRKLLLARDPYGIKPLYLADDGRTVRFASQVKALLAGGGVDREPEPAGIVGFHLWGSVPEPFTLYRGISAVPAGCIQWIDSAGVHPPEPYASIGDELAKHPRLSAAPAEIGLRVRDAALDSVRAHLLADVEVGVFLSAGVNSGVLLGLMRDAGHDKATAVTLAFEEFAGTPQDEAPIARQVAETYGARHIVRTVNETEFRSDLPAILEAMDQPSIDGVNTWFVAKAAHEAGLKVALSGVGGDELLAGYPGFRQIPRLVNALRWPAAVPGAGDAARMALQAFGISGRSPKALGLLKYGGDYAGAYLLRRGLFLPFELDAILDPQVVREGLRRLSTMDRLRATIAHDPGSPIGRVAALESTQYLRCQLLRDADWAGMAHSVEIRTPLVDIELLRSLAPLVPAFGDGAGKRALATAPRTPLPDIVANRDKTGFCVPTERWMAAASRPRRSDDGASRTWGLRVFDHMMPAL